MFLDLLTSREKVTLASTEAEIDAICRLRYKIYSEEKGWDYGGVDHERKMVMDDLDW